MSVRALPLVAAVTPALGVFTAYWLAVNSGVLPACSPFLDGCVSISATGRYMPASLVFNAIMLPQSVVLAFVWYFCAQWLRSMAPTSRAPATIVVAGLVGALALILYVSFLGTKAPFYEFMRRFGIYFYFLGTVTAQLTLAIPFLNHTRRVGDRYLNRLALSMLGLCCMPFALGILNLVLKSLLDNADFAENRIEWISALLMQIYFVVVYLAWRATSFEISVRTS